MPLAHSTGGVDHLAALDTTPTKLTGHYRIAFVIGGTDVLRCDRLGGLRLSIADVIQRDAAVLNVLRSLSVPAVVLGGGGYSRESVQAVAGSIIANFGTLS